MSSENNSIDQMYRELNSLESTLSRITSYMEESQIEAGSWQLIDDLSSYALELMSRLNYLKWKIKTIESC